MGFRGFATKQTLNLAIPNGNPGSGLTVLVGPNGGGKSTLVECFNKISLANRSVSFSAGKRNKMAGDVVEIEVYFDEGRGALKTINGGSESRWEGPSIPSIYYLPSRRFFNPYFSINRWDRDTYLNNPPTFQIRTTPLDTCTYRLVDLNKGDSARFNTILGTILGKPLQWTIDQDDTGQYYVKITKGHGLHHNSDGMGEGVLSLMFIVDALCGTKNELIVIDEPELSLHPQLQRRLLDEILEKTRYSQVVISTHSPSMLSLESIVNGGMVARVYETSEGTKVREIDDRSRKFIASAEQNLNNPHILGTDARACFFAEDSLIITEGQEDVVLYPVVLKNLGMNPYMPFFGFGAGGASGIREVAHLLHVLGFEKIGAIYDGDKKEEYDAFISDFSAYGYKAWIIPADDIRDKERYEAPSKVGLLDSHKKILKPEFVDPLALIFRSIEDYLRS
jgi:predicted ATPase